MDNFHAYIFHGNFCFPCGNSFPWNTAKFLSDFLFPLISTRFSLDTYSSRNAQGFPWYLLVGNTFSMFLYLVCISLAVSANTTVFNDGIYAPQEVKHGAHYGRNL